MGVAAHEQMDLVQISASLQSGSKRCTMVKTIKLPYKLGAKAFYGSGARDGFLENG